MSFAEYLRTGELAPFRLGMPKSQVLDILSGDRRFGEIDIGSRGDLVGVMGLFLQLFFGEERLRGVGFYFIHHQPPTARKMWPDLRLLKKPTCDHLMQFMIAQRISFRVNFALKQLNLISEGGVHCCFQDNGDFEKAGSFEGGPGL